MVTAVTVTVHYALTKKTEKAVVCERRTLK